MVYFNRTQSNILLCGIARFSRGDKNKLRTSQPQKGKKIKNSQPQTKFAGSYKKESVRHLRSYISQKTVISMLLSMPTLKSPKTMKFSYLDAYKAKPLCRISM